MAFSYFFRDFEALNSGISLLKKLADEQKNIKIWNPGCAYGKESFSIAMIIAEIFGIDALENTSILASDVDISDRFKAFFEKAEYNLSDFERIPGEFKKYFEIKHNKAFLMYEIIENIRYIKHDLLSFYTNTHDLNLIVCKNCLMHFNDFSKCKVLQMFYNALGKNGVLIVGQNQDIENSNIEDFFVPSNLNKLVFIKKEKKS